MRAHLFEWPDGTKAHVRAELLGYDEAAFQARFAEATAGSAEAAQELHERAVRVACKLNMAEPAGRC